MSNSASNDLDKGKSKVEELTKDESTMPLSHEDRELAMMYIHDLDRLIRNKRTFPYSDSIVVSSLEILELTHNIEGAINRNHND